MGRIFRGFFGIVPCIFEILSRRLGEGSGGKPEAESEDSGSNKRLHARASSMPMAIRPRLRAKDRDHHKKPKNYEVLRANSASQSRLRAQKRFDLRNQQLITRGAWVV